MIVFMFYVCDLQVIMLGLDTGIGMSKIHAFVVSLISVIQDYWGTG